MSLDTAIAEAVRAALASEADHLRAIVREELARSRPMLAANDGPLQAISVQTAAARSDYSEETILNAIERKDLSAHKPRGSREWRIPTLGFEAWLCGKADHLHPADPKKEREARFLAKLR